MGDPADGEREFTPLDYPPYPDDIATAQLETFHLDDLHATSTGGHGERLLQTCRQDGCFYLSMDENDEGNVVREAARMMRVLEPVFRLSREEKDLYIPHDPLALVGYKKVGASVVDSENTPDSAEFFNVCSPGLWTDIG